MEMTLEKNVEAAYTGEEMLEACTKYTWKHYKGLNEFDRDEVIGQMVMGMVEACNKAEAGQNVRAYQWSYAVGYAKHYFDTRTEIGKKENVRLDYHHGEDGECEGEGRSCTMADMMADESLPENLSVEMMEALASLDHKERQFIQLRFLENRSNAEILKALGIDCRLDLSTSRINIMRLEAKALAKLRARLTVKAA